MFVFGMKSVINDWSHALLWYVIIVYYSFNQLKKILNYKFCIGILTLIGLCFMIYFVNLV
jgi:hypothetical protein